MNILEAAQEVNKFASTKDAKSHLRGVLRGLKTAGFRKTGSIGGEQEAGFEQAFASLAYAYVKDKAPRLLDFLVGFQLVDRNEDNTKAMGVFGFKIGNQWIYAPVFFLNGDLKGHELLYVKKTDSFVPMKENWINYLMSRKPHILGQGVDQQPHEMGALLPVISQLSVPPRNNKFASATPGLPEWVRPAMPCFSSLMLTDVEKFASIVNNGLPLMKEWKGVDDFVEQDFALVKGAFDLYMKYPSFKHGIDRFYGGTKLFRNAALQVKQAAAVPGKTNIMPPKPPAAPKAPKVKAPEAPKPPAAPKPPKAVYASDNSIIPLQAKEAVGDPVSITVNTDDVITKNLPELTEEEREKLLKDPVLVRDRREPGEITKAYNTQVKSELVNPDRTRRFLILTKPGEFKKLLVITKPHDGRGLNNWCTVVDTDSGKWINTNQTEVWARPDMTQEDSDEDYRNWLDEKSDVKSLSVGSTYVVLGKSGQGTVPFTVKEDHGDGCYLVNYHDDAKVKRPLGLARHDDDKSRGYDPYLDDYAPWRAYVKINFRKGSRFKSVGGVLYLPEDAKAVSLNKNDEDSTEYDADGGESGTMSKDSPLMLGNLADIQNEILQKTARLKLYDDNNEIVIDSAKYGSMRLSKMAGFVHLIKDHGLTEQTSRNMLKEAARKGLSSTGIIFRLAYGPNYPREKTAFSPGGIGGNMLRGAPGAPGMPDPEYGYDSTFGGAPTQYQMTHFEQVPGMESDNTDPNIYNPHNVPDPMAVQYGQEAANRGQKQVFDTAMLGSMLKAVREDSIVDRYLGDLMKALDRLGRVLFMFYWHQEEFQERYGKADLPELEDSLRNAFEVLGDVVLYLKQKTIDTDFGSEMGEPDVEEAAMN